MDGPHEITAIRSRRGSRRRELELDGAGWLSVSQPVLAALAIASGDVVDPDEITARIAILEPPAARERALRLLAYRDRSASEIHARLAEDGYSESTVDDVVGWLLETGLVDDERFAEQLARSLVVGRRYGRSRSLRHLLHSGISEDIARRALDAAAPGEDECDRAAGLARSLLRSGDTAERLASRLVRRGYATSDALSAARAVVGETDSEDERDDGV